MKSHWLLTRPYKNNRTAKSICAAYDFLIGEGYTMAVDYVAQNSFFKTMDLEWIEKYESYLGITPIAQGSLTYEEWLDIRRRTIATSQGNFVYKTEPWLRDRLTEILGDIPFTLEVYHDEYLILFYVDQDVSSDVFGQAKMIIEDVRPLNMRKFIGRVLELELPISLSITGSSQEPGDTETRYIKMPEDQSITSYLAGLIATFVSQQSDNVVLYSGSASKTYQIENKIVNGSSFQFVLDIAYEDIPVLTKFETYDSSGNMLAQFPKEGSGEELSVAIPTAGMAINVLWKVVERNVPTSGQYVITWKDQDGQPINDDSLPETGTPTDRIFLPESTRAGYKITGYTVNGDAYQVGTYFIMPNGPAAVIATYEQTEYALVIHSQYTIYDGSGGPIVPKQRTFPLGTVVDVSQYTVGEEIYKDNTVRGMFYDPDFQQQATTVTMDRDVDLYAWYSPRFLQYYTNIYQNGVLLEENVPMLGETYDRLLTTFALKTVQPTYALAANPASQPIGWERVQDSAVHMNVSDIRTSSGYLSVPNNGIVNTGVRLFSDTVRIRAGTPIVGVQGVIQYLGATLKTIQTSGNGAFVTMEFEQQSQYAIINYNTTQIASFELWVNDTKIV